MAENFSIEHSRTKITEVKKTIEDKKQKLDELWMPGLRWILQI